MSMPFNLKDTALQLIGQKKNIDVSDIIAKVKEHMKSGDQTDAVLDGKELAEAVKTRVVIHRLLKEAIAKDLSVLAKGARPLSREKQKSLEGIPADIICKDKDRNTVVVEIFVGEAGIDQIAAIIGLMGSAAALENAPVRGVLAANEFPEHVVNAAGVVDCLRLLKYDYGFGMKFMEG